MVEATARVGLVRLRGVAKLLAEHGPVQTIGLHLDAGNSKDGAPRRLYVVLFESRHAVAYEEGYRGEQCVPREVRVLMKGWVHFRIPLGEYNKLRKAV